MIFELRLKRSVQKDFKRLGQEAAKKVMRAIRAKILIDPRLGKQLKGEASEFWSYRTGDYRIIYTFNESELWVLVVLARHRKDVYKRLLP